MKVPNWLKKDFDKSKCNFCGNNLEEKNILIHGVGYSKLNKKTQLTHSMHYSCPHCKTISIYTYQTTWRDYIKDIIEISDNSVEKVIDDIFKEEKSFLNEEENSEENTENTDPNDFEYLDNLKSKISKSELSDVKKDLDESNDLKDFLIKIGIIKPGDKDERK